MKWKIKCAVYENYENYGGGCWYIPVEHHEEIFKKLKKERNKIHSEPIGIYEFELSYLNDVIHIGNAIKKITADTYWDGTWCE